MKKLLSLLLCVLLLTATLTSCALITTPGKMHGGKEDPPKAHTSTSITTTTSDHDHGTTTGADDNGTDVAPKVKYQVYTNADKTYRLVIRDQRNAILFEADKLLRSPIHEAVDEQKGIYELGWATGSGSAEYECVYYNEKTGQVSRQFRAPLGTDGVRIAYPTEDQTRIIVQELFNEKGYQKAHTLEDAYNGNGTVIAGGKLQADKKTVLVSYYTNEKGESRHVAIPLYQ